VCLILQANAGRSGGVPGDRIGLRDVRTVPSRQCFNLWRLGDFCNRWPWKSRAPIAYAQWLCVADDRIAGGTTAQQLPNRLSSNPEIAPQAFLIAHLRSMQFKAIGQRLQIAGPNEFWRGSDGRSLHGETVKATNRSTPFAISIGQARHFDFLPQ
jgi:hypothetical protein